MKYEIRPITPDNRNSVLDALSAAFGGGFDSRWFEWKHEAGPWGRSPGWVARDDGGLIGVRLFLPWRFRQGQRVYRALRPCDTVTVPRARGMGVFRNLTETAMNATSDSVDFYYNTPNSQSRPGYLKMGYVQWTSVVQHAGVVISRRARLDSPRLDIPPADATSMRTATSDAFLEWRYRRCPRYQYELFALAEADSANGIVCRVRAARGRRMLAVSELWGSHREKRALLRAAAAELSTRIVWITAEHQGSVPVSLRRQGTVVTRYDVSTANLSSPCFSLGDIEDVL